VEKALAEDKFKQIGIEMMQEDMILRNTEKLAEQRKEQIDNLEKIRDAQIKTAAENADTVSIYNS